MHVVSVYTHMHTSPQRPVLGFRVCTARCLEKGISNCCPSPERVAAVVWSCAFAMYSRGRVVRVVSQPCACHSTEPKQILGCRQHQHGAGNTSVVQARSCFNIQNKALEGKALPPFVLCSWGIIRIWQPVPLKPHSILKASQSMVLLGSTLWCLGLLRTSSRSFLTWFGQTKWPNTIEKSNRLSF